jgi:hypothetical protein
MACLATYGVRLVLQINAFSMQLLQMACMAASVAVAATLVPAAAETQEKATTAGGSVSGLDVLHAGERIVTHLPTPLYQQQQQKQLLVSNGKWIVLPLAGKPCAWCASHEQSSVFRGAKLYLYCIAGFGGPPDACCAGKPSSNCLGTLLLLLWLCRPVFLSML